MLSMDSSPVESLIGQRVRVDRTTTRDTYYGTLVGADGSWVHLVNAVWGWYGESGWWAHGGADFTLLPTVSVESITPSDEK